MIVTNHMLKKKFAEVNREVRVITTNANPQQVLEETGTVLIYTQKITKVQGDYVITEKNIKAKLYNPIPCIHWKCLVTPDKNGIMTLKKSIEGLFIDDGTHQYCLGLTGVTDEFEIRLQVGTNEIRLNDLFLNVNVPHLILNGTEATTNE